MQILRLPSVKEQTGHRSDTSIYNAIRAGVFSRGKAIGQRARGWPSGDMAAINQARIAGKSDAEIRELVKTLHAKRTDPANALATV